MSDVSFLENVKDGPDALVRDPVADSRLPAGSADDARRAEDAQMLRDVRLGDPQAFLDFRDAALLLHQPPQKLQARRMGEGFEDQDGIDGAVLHGVHLKYTRIII
jgi:hypothetical protein